MNKHRLEQAADWLDQEQELNEQQQSELKQWLAVPENASAYQKMKGVMASDELTQALNHPAEQTVVNIKRPLKVTSYLALAASVTCLGVLVYFMTSMQPEQLRDVPVAATSNVYQLELESPLAQRSSKVLIDGTQLHLNANSAVQIQQNSAQRHVTLTSGQVYFDVAKDATRPFVIDVGQTKVTVLGTAFDIDYTTAHTTIRVYEGHVKVQAGQSIELTAGQSLAISGDKLQIEDDAHLGMLPSWRSGWLEADDLPLAQVVEKLQRYLPKPVALSSSELADIPIVGRFSLDDPQQALALLASAHQLRLLDESNQFVLQR